MSSSEPQRAATPVQHRIGLWGPTSSGKTSFLAALRIASMRANLPGNWLMSGGDPESSNFMIDSVNDMTDRKQFPNATLNERPYVFRFTGEAPPKRSLLGRRTVPDRLAFELDVLDVPGVWFRGSGHSEADYVAGYSSSVGSYGPSADDHDPDSDADSDPTSDTDPSFRGPPIALASPLSSVVESTSSLREEREELLLSHLESCDGIVFLFDPVSGGEGDKSFQFFHAILEKLASRYFSQEQYGGARLPQHVAVCISKFDQPEIYQLAKRGGYTMQDAQKPFLPRVPDEKAKAFFEALSRAYPDGNADLVFNCMERFFRNVNYFVTSSIGFHVGDGDRFRPHDPLNIVDRARGGMNGVQGSGVGIRGKVHPINVLEPVLWLHKSLEGGR